MAYVNVREWSPDQVAEWLKGLDESVLPYIHYFVNNRVDGRRLLQLSPDDLPRLCVTKVGHQEIILQAVELLRNIHYQLDQENVQYLALRLSSKARSIYCELQQVINSQASNGVGPRCGGGSAGEEEEGSEDGNQGQGREAHERQERVSTAIIAGVADVLSAVKRLVCWLNRQPFEGQDRYDELKSTLVQLSIHLATIAQRDMFAENQATIIHQLCYKLADISDAIIQEYDDPLIIQPASLDIATVKKKADDEWGLILQSSYQGVHQVSGVRALSPAYQCGKLQEGDELIQVNYQTIVGWSPHKVTAVMQEFPVEVILTVKKCPRHTNTVNQIYLKPMRLPSKKRTYSPWGFSFTPTPARIDLQSIPNLQLPKSRGASSEPRPESSTPPPQHPTPSPQPPSSVSDGHSTTSERESDQLDSDVSEEDDDAFLSDSDIGGSSALSVRLYHPKPRAHVLRRATIPGATTRHTLTIDQLLQDMRWSRVGQGGHAEGSDPDLLRSPSGLDRRPARPHTCIGTENKSGMGKDAQRQTQKLGVDGVKEEEVDGDEMNESQSENAENKAGGEAGSNEGEKKVVNVIPLPPRKPTNVASGSSSHQQSPQAEKKKHLLNPPSLMLSLDVGTVGIDPDGTLGRQRRVSEDRPKLDKSHSTPAYDGEEEAASTPSSAPPAERSRTLKAPPAHTKLSPGTNISSRSNKDSSHSSSSNKHSPSTHSSSSNKQQSPSTNSTSSSNKHSPSTHSASFSNKQSPSSHSIASSNKHSPSTHSSSSSNKQSPVTPTTPKSTTGIGKQSSVKRTSQTPTSSKHSTGSLRNSNGKQNAAVAMKQVSAVPSVTTNTAPHSTAKGTLVPTSPSGAGVSPSMSRLKCSPTASHPVLSPTASLPMQPPSSSNTPTSGNIISSATTTIGSGSGQQFRAAVTFPISAAEGKVGGGREEGGSKEDGGEAGRSCEGRGGLEGSSASGVVLRETRSSSPSVWRRGILHTDRGSRRISCRELGQGDHQGWLHRRRDNKGFLLPHRWERRWFILKKNYLYGYRDREAVRADSLIYLPGFDVSPATDVKAKKFAFKIYHSSGATFYFACDTSEERSRWMSQMGLSAVTHQRHSQATSPTSTQQQNSHTHQHPSTTPQHQNQVAGEEVYYSETDDELDDRPCTSPLSPQSPPSRTSPGKEGVASLWPGSSASSNSRGPGAGGGPGRGRSSPLSVLGTSRTPGLKFLQPSRDVMNQPVPTASFRSYRRVSDSSSRSTSTGDLRKDTGSGVGSTEGGTGKRVARKNSLRDRIRQFPASLTLDRRRTSTTRAPDIKNTKKAQDKPDQQVETSKDTVKSPEHQQNHAEENGTLAKESVQVESPCPTPTSPTSEAGPWVGDGVGSQRPRPHYMLPTRASSQHSPVRPTSIDLDTRCSPSRSGGTRGAVSPPASGRSSPLKIDVSGRRGSIGGDSPVRCTSPRRGSLDCLAWSQHRAFSPPVSPVHTPTRSSHGSASSLLASEEYREGSPEKLWINSLRTDPARSRSGIRSSPEKRDSRSRSGSGEAQVPERLKRAALYHPPLLRPRTDPMKAAFELTLDPASGEVVCTTRHTHDGSTQAGNIEVSPVTSLTKRPHTSSATIRPEVPPRTKFLSPSERTLPPSSSTSSISPSNSAGPSGSSLSPSPSPSTMSLASSRSASSQSTYSGGQPSNQAGPRRVPNLTIRAPTDDTEAVRTPLKPAMGVSMIGKQRRTPNLVSPRDVFFASPPASPTVPFSPTQMSSPIALASPPPPTASPSSSIHLPGDSPVTAKFRAQKILPHYPGMEYPPVFEPGSYSLCPNEQAVANSRLSGQQDKNTQEQAEGTNTNIQTHVVFSVAQPTSPQPTVHLSNTRISGEERRYSGERGDLRQQVTSPREYKSQRNIVIGSSPGGNHALNIIVSPHTPPRFSTPSSTASSSSQNIYTSFPETASHHSTTTATHHHITVADSRYSTTVAPHPYPTATTSPHHHHHQNLYVASPAHTTTHHNIYVSSPVASSGLHMAGISRTVGRNMEARVPPGMSHNGGQRYPVEQPSRPSRNRLPPPAPPNSSQGNVETDNSISSSQTDLPNQS